MAARKKKRRRRPSHKDASPQKLSVAELEERGDFLLREEKYKEAIDCFKQLLKHEHKKHYFQGLEKAYLGRATALAGQSMYKEALAMLDTLNNRYPASKTAHHKLTLLIQSENYQEAAAFYQLCHDQLSSDQRQQIEALFGALLLAGTGVTLMDLPSASPIVRFYPNAVAALEVFFTGDRGALTEALRQVPVRSPYRDVRLLLDGLHHFPTDKSRAGDYLKKIGKDSPYGVFAAAYSSDYESCDSLLNSIAEHQKVDSFWELRLRSVSPSGVKVLKDLARFDGTPIQLYKIIRRHERCFTARDKRTLYKNILPFCQEQAVDIVKRLPMFSAVEKYRIAALAAEQDQVFDIATSYWSDYLDEIGYEDPDKWRLVAMVLRHQVDLMKKAPYAYSPQQILNTLMDSLAYDPDHAQTWLEASEYAKQYDKLNRYYAIIRDAVKKLPDNVPILLAAMKASRNRGAHKKAAELAARVLELDPINTTALDSSVASRLEHGRRLAVRKKWALAEEQILAADTRVRSVRLVGRKQICLGMLFLLQQNESGLQHIDDGRRQNPYPLLGHFLVALEARLFGLPRQRQKTFDTSLRNYAKTSISNDGKELRHLISWILDSEDKNWLLLKKTCQALANYFSKTAVSQLNFAEGLSLCLALERMDLIAALASCACRLKTKFPDEPELKLWCLLASTWDKNKVSTHYLYSELDTIFEELAEKDRFDFIEQIEQIIKQRGLPRPDPFDPEYIGEVVLDDLGPFTMPEIAHDEHIKPKKPRPQEPKRRQLNLFDDE
jgi:tetratricopeptide (TPR) repeat protein